MTTEHQKLKVENRSVLGKNLRKMKKTGNIPAVVYGNKITSTAITIDLNEFIKVFRETGQTGVVEIQLDDKKIPCLIHDIDLNPIHDIPRHVDFLAVNLNKKIEIEVPVILIGKPEGSVEGFILSQSLQEVIVEAKPDSVPSEIEIDVTHLKEIGDQIMVGDIPQGEKYTIITDAEQVIASLTPPQVEEEQPTPETEIVTGQSEEIEVASDPNSEAKTENPTK